MIHPPRNKYHPDTEISNNLNKSSCLATLKNSQRVHPHKWHRKPLKNFKNNAEKFLKFSSIVS